MAASPKQIEFINKLIEKKVVPAPLREHADNVLAHATDVSGRTVSSLIDDLKLCEWKFLAAAAALPVLEPGTYQDGEIIIRVQRNRQTGRPYAKVWNGSGWDYDGSAYRTHAASAVVIPLDRALAIGVATGHCVVCAIDLRDPVSVEAGIGPVCVKRYGTTREAIIEGRRQLALQPA